MPKIIRNEIEYSSTTSTANQINYLNTVSGLSATNVQNAIDEVVVDVNTKADRVALPDEYDATSTYSKGDLVTYNNNIYQCNTTISTAEAWNSSHWQLITPDTDYLHSINPNGNGAFSLNRKANTTVGTCSFAEGYNTTASGQYSHAEGYGTTASGQSSHAEGWSTTANSPSSHAEGSDTSASGSYSHAEGYNTSTSGLYSHAEGHNTIASGQSSHAEGRSTTANHKSQHTFGEYNVLDTSTAGYYERGNYVEIVGNGTTDNARSNARTLDWDGNEVLAGGLKINGDKDVPTKEYVDTNITSDRTRLTKIETTTVSATKGSTMPSGFPATPSAITRCGAIVTVQFGQKIPAGTYTASDTLWTMTPTPRAIARAVVQTGAYYNIINILGTGEIRFNNQIYFESESWLIGQLTYITAL